MQDIEFTIQGGRLWMLQTRVGKRTGTAALNMAMDMLSEKLIDKRMAVMRLKPEQLDELDGEVFGAARLSELGDFDELDQAAKSLLVCFDGRTGWVALEHLLEVRGRTWQPGNPGLLA